jgi:ribose-phosphate pyrophosphokinase
MSKIQLFAGNSNPQLAKDIAKHLKIPLGKAIVGRFNDGEINVEILEHVRGGDIFVIQSTCAPANDNLMELAIISDALRRASATNITAVVPYFGYARQDRRVRSARVPITAKVVADIMASVGIAHLLTFDLHADQIQGFFDIPVDNLYATQVAFDDIKEKGFKNIAVVSPDVGGVVRARAIAKRLSSDLVIIDKRRPKPNQSEVMNIIGEVKDRDCLIFDDIVDTAGTLCQAAAALKENGATSVSAYCTHPVLSDNSVERIANSVLNELVVTDTIPLSKEAQNCKKIRQLSLSKTLAETIVRVSNKESVSSLFAD